MLAILKPTLQALQDTWVEMGRDGEEIRSELKAFTGVCSLGAPGEEDPGSAIFDSFDLSSTGGPALVSVDVIYVLTGLWKCAEGGFNVGLCLFA